MRATQPTEGGTEAAQNV